MSASAQTPQIYTYHCFCSQLLLATPYTLSSLPRRKGPTGSDAALILPLGEPPGTTLTAEDLSLEDKESTGVGKKVENNDTDNGAGEIDGEDGAGGRVGYSLLVNTTLDRKPVVVRREDGFEKRWLRRCGRCRVVVGYLVAVKEGEKEGKEKAGKGRVVYLLEGGLKATEELRKEVET